MTIEELKKQKIWVCRNNKIPINPLTGDNASVIDKNTWATYDIAINSSVKHNGVGLVLTNGICRHRY